MPRVSFTTHLLKYVDCPPTHVTGSTVREALDAVFAENGRLRGYIVDEVGCLRKHIAVFVDGDVIVDRQHQSDAVNDSPGTQRPFQPGICW